MSKNILFKLLSILALVTLIANLTPAPVTLKAQPANPTILIPLENFVFTPKKESFTKPGVTDLEVKVVQYNAIAAGSSCKFTFAQLEKGLPQVSTSQSLVTSQTTVSSRYENSSCGAVLKKEEQKSVNIRVVVEVTTPTNEIFGSYINFLSNDFQQDINIVDQNEYTLPAELYVKPEINLILEKKQLFVGDKVKVQVEITNNDNFVLKEFSIKNSIPDRIGKIDCESFQATDQRLNGDFIKLPKVEVFAQNNNSDSNLEAKCVLDQFNFEANLVSLRPKQTSRLNFDISVEKPGKLRFEIGTNLDQGRISKTTEAIEIIVPSQDNNNISAWVLPSILILLALAGGGYGYYKFRQMKKRQKLNETIESK